MAVTNPYTILLGGMIVGGFLTAALLGPLFDHYGKIRTASFVSAALTVAFAVVIALIGVVF